MALAWTKEHDLKLIFALEKATGVEYLHANARNQGFFDWGKVNLTTQTWPADVSLDTLKLRFVELLQAWKSDGTSHGGVSLAEWRRRLTLEEERQLFSSNNQEKKWLSLFETFRNDPSWRVRVVGIEPCFEFEYLLRLSLDQRQVFLEYLARGMRVYQLPGLTYDARSVLHALGRLLHVSLPDHLTFLSTLISKKDTKKANEMLIKCLEDSKSLPRVQINVLNNSPTNKVLWRDNLVPLIIIARQGTGYCPVLRMERRDDNQMTRFQSPIPEYLFRFRVDAIQTPFTTGISLQINERVEFEVEGKSVEVVVVVAKRRPPFSSPPEVHHHSLPVPQVESQPERQAQQLCSICQLSLDSFSVEQQEAHMRSCSEKQDAQRKAQAGVALSQIDDRLKARGLERNPVASDGYCYLRALLSAQGKPSTEADVLALFRAIWNYAKGKEFACFSLTESHRQELLLLDTPEEHLLRTSFATDAKISSDTAFEAFYNVISLFAAPLINRDIYIVSQEARQCTLFPRSTSPPSLVPLVTVSTALSSSEGVALLHLKEPSLHFDWIGLEVLPTTSTTHMEEDRPPSPTMMTMITPETCADALPVNEQLSLLLSGATLKMSSRQRGWWQSLESVSQRFASTTGKLVWYSKKAHNVWLQHPVGDLPSDCPLPACPSVKQWLAWRDSAASISENNLKDLYYLIDVDISNKDLDELILALPILGVFDDRTSIYSLNAYLRAMCPTLARCMPDLRPRLYLSPGLVRGAVSTSLHFDGLGHMLSYHWSLGFCSEEETNIVDIYPPEEELGQQRYHQLRSIAGAAMSLDGLCLPHSVSHESHVSVRHGCDEYDRLEQANILPKKSIDLHAGEMLILPAGQPHAFKKWSKSIQVSLAGDISWLGRDRVEASEAIKRMIRVEKHLKEAYCLPELGMLACLLSAAKRSPSTLIQEHLAAFEEHLRPLVSQEVTLLSSQALSSASIAGVIDDHQLWSCSTCTHVVLNTIVWCQVTDEAYCLTCYLNVCASLKRRGNSKRARGLEDFMVSFRFDHPSKLSSLLLPTEEHVPTAPTPSLVPASAPTLVFPSPPPSPELASMPHSSPPPSPSSLLETISQEISLGRIDDDSHMLCELALKLEKDKSLSKLQREQLLLMGRDLPRFCHTQADANRCPLVATESQREVTYEEEFRRKYRCSVIEARGKCNKLGTWSRPLHACSGEGHASLFLFHLDCAGYGDVKVPSGVKLLCPSCLKSKREEKSLSAFRTQHIWETLQAQRELHTHGYRCISIPADGLCFFTVLFMLSRAQSSVPKPSQVLDWLRDRPMSALLREIRSRPSDDPLRGVEGEVLAWTSRSSEEWMRGGWDSDHLDVVCSMLPDLLRREKVLTVEFYRFSYDSIKEAGSWFDIDGKKLLGGVPKGVRFAVFHSQTPIAHYVLLERQTTDDKLEQLNDGEMLGSTIIASYLHDVLAKEHSSCFYLDPSFFTKLSACKTIDDVKALFRWFKRLNLAVHEKIFIPIHQPRHWCLVVLDVKLCQVEYYDSYNKETKQVAERVAKELVKFFELLFKEFRYKPLTSTSRWRILQPPDRPFQENGIDCGVFICAYARCRSVQPFNVFDFQVEDIQRIRQDMKEALSRLC